MTEPELQSWFANQQSAENPRIPEVVHYPRVRCPFCRQTETRVTSSPLPIRYHKCNRCGRNFKTVDP